MVFLPLCLAEDGVFGITRDRGADGLVGSADLLAGDGTLLPTPGVGLEVGVNGLHRLIQRLHCLMHGLVRAVGDPALVFMHVRCHGHILIEGHRFVSKRSYSQIPGPISVRSLKIANGTSSGNTHRGRTKITDMTSLGNYFVSGQVERTEAAQTEAD